ncbi:MAG: PAS domain-containing protein [Pyrinomonadaceae bacterium]|nr:PAS domain-containing protein [Pyrinomonadaceae bacterium]
MGLDGCHHSDDRKGLEDYWRSVLASGEPGEIEARLRRFDGEYRWFLFRATPSFDNDGRVVKWFGTNTDIEDRKRNLDLKDVGVVDRDVVCFFVRCEADGVTLENCAAYIREWMEKERD